MDWQKAACKGTDPERWFPGPSTPTFDLREICQRCPIRRPCLEDAIATNADGYRGGTGQNERRRIRKQRLSVASG